MKVLYFDPILGASGDMLLAALIDLGVKKGYLVKNLSFIPGFEMKVGSVMQSGVRARSVRFIIKKKVGEKRFIPLIKKSQLPESLKMQVIAIIERIFEVEKRVHCTQHLHLHELGDTDTLLDITGVVLALDALRVDRVYSRAVKAGTGLIKTAEGNMPAFNFATALLLKNFPVQFLPIPAELTTPTGAVILSSLAKPTEELMLSRIVKVGLGAGTHKIEGYPNLLRVFLGEIDESIHDDCWIIETNIDDMNPQDFELIFEKLYQAGALEVFLTPTIMKHSRPGVLLTVLVQDNYTRIADIIFEHTTTIGLRIRRTQRLKLKREIKKVSTPFGRIQIKMITHKGKRRYAFEYQDLKRLSQQKNLPLRTLRQRLSAYLNKNI